MDNYLRVVKLNENTGQKYIEFSYGLVVSEKAKEVLVEIELYYDEVAMLNGYYSALYCLSRTGYNNIFKEECTRYAEWMDTCNSICYQIIKDCEINNTELPSKEELLMQLPIFTW